MNFEIASLNPPTTPSWPQAPNAASEASSANQSRLIWKKTLDDHVGETGPRSDPSLPSAPATPPSPLHPDTAAALTNTPPAAPAAATTSNAAASATYTRMSDGGYDANNASDPTAATTGSNGKSGEATGMDRFLWGKDGLTFGSILRSLNPLQHIPIISTIYRHLTGDSIGAVARTIGGALLGGPIGAITSLASSIFESATGKDPGETVLTALLGDDKSVPAASATNIASATPQALPKGAVEVAGLPWLAPGGPTPSIPANLAQAPAPLPPGAVQVANLPWLSPSDTSTGAIPGDFASLSAALPAGATQVAGLPWLTAASPATSARANLAQAAPLARLAGSTTPTTRFIPNAGSIAGAKLTPQLAAVPASTEIAAARNAGRVIAPTDFPKRMMDALDKYQAAAKLHGLKPALSIDFGG